MRIIAGQFRGRKFNPPKGHYPTRPTTDMAREGLFNILQHRMDISEAKVLDLFAGFGGHGYEWASRGCQDITLVEQHAKCVQFIKGMVEELSIAEQTKIIRGDVFTFLEGCDSLYSFIFADPPYQLPTLDTLPDIVFRKGLLEDGGQFVLEHDTTHSFSKHPHFKEERSYGGTVFSFFG